MLSLLSFSKTAWSISVISDSSSKNVDIIEGAAFWLHRTASTFQNHLNSISWQGGDCHLQGWVAQCVPLPNLNESRSLVDFHCTQGIVPIEALGSLKSLPFCRYMYDMYCRYHGAFARCRTHLVEQHLQASNSVHQRPCTSQMMQNVRFATTSILNAFGKEGEQLIVHCQSLVSNWDLDLDCIDHGISWEFEFRIREAQNDNQSKNEPCQLRLPKMIYFTV